MKTLKYILMNCIMLTWGNILLAQQETQFTQYMYNTVSFNPAYAGSTGTLNANLLYRTQWVGLEGAPKTQFFSINNPVSYNTAMGVSIINDEIGPSKDLYVDIDASYTIYLNNDINFAFGMKVGLQSLQIDYNKLDTYNPIDSQFSNNVSSIKPQIGIGGYLYAENWYMGLSVPNMLKTEFYDDVAVSTASKRQHFFFISGYVFELSRAVKLKPATLTKVVSGSPIAVDVSVNVLLHEKLTLGTSYRLDSGISALAGFQLSNNLMIGYGYDFDTTELSQYNSGSHELFLKFEILNRSKGKVSPRFF